MRTNRRRFLTSAAALAAAPAAAGADIGPKITNGQVDWDAVRNDFPWIQNSLWLSASDFHPLSIYSQRALETYYKWRIGGPRGGGSRFSGDMQRETKEMFGQVINAKPNEIAFTHNTTEGENIVIAGMDLVRKKGNVVLDDLHYQASKFIYHMLERDGDIELRVVRSRKDDFLAHGSKRHDRGH